MHFSKVKWFVIQLRETTIYERIKNSKDMIYILRIYLKINFTVSYMLASSGPRIKVKFWNPRNPFNTDNKIANEDGNIYHDFQSITMVIMAVLYMFFSHPPPTPMSGSYKFFLSMSLDFFFRLHI